MRRHLIRWGIVAAFVVAAGALPAGGHHQRVDFSDMPAAVSTVKINVIRDKVGPFRTPQAPHS